MQSKGKSTSAAERRHVAWIKDQRCVVCGHSAPSIAHHIRQDSHFYTVPLCESCHVGPHNGIHGGQAMWRLKKMDELDALAKTVEMAVANG